MDVHPTKNGIVLIHSHMEISIHVWNHQPDKNQSTDISDHCFPSKLGENWRAGAPGVSGIGRG